MTTNRLSGGKGGNFVSSSSARQWAQMARDKGHMDAAVAWERADREGWDDEHYDPNWDPIHKRISPTGGR
jgi:hypothetical protein